MQKEAAMRNRRVWLRSLVATLAAIAAQLAWAAAAAACTGGGDFPRYWR
jgi:hypothetical protein